MLPPCPPCLGDMRRMACLAQSTGASTLVLRILRMRNSDISSTRDFCPTVPALFTSAVTRPSSLSTRLNKAMTSSSMLTSARTAMAWAPKARTWSSTVCAACSSAW
ncbi:hypothetical protein D3C78_1692620 [compost metagenome]